MASNDSTRNLSTDLIAEPSMHRLVLLVSDSGIDIVIASRVRDKDIIYRHVDFIAGVDPVKGLEEVVYDNPLLTADFYSTNILIDNRRFFIMAEEDITDEEVARRIEVLWPAQRRNTDYVAAMSDIEDGRTKMITAIDRRLLAFLRRTWNNPVVWHRVGTIARFFSLRNKLGNMGKVHARITANRLDLFVFGRDGLLLANTFAIAGGVDDAAYYVLAAAQHLGFDNEIDRVMVSGDSDMRDELVAKLRRFVPFVLPEIFPASVSDVADNDGVPFEALLLPLI